MAFDPQAFPSEGRAAAIENEIPTYRAISKLAVTSLLCGVFSVLTFADPAFLILVVLAIITGLWAQVRIRRMPDILTGSRLAQTGTALAVVFARYSDSSALCIKSSALTLPAARSAIAIPTETVTVMSAAREWRVR